VSRRKRQLHRAPLEGGGKRISSRATLDCQQRDAAGREDKMKREECSGKPDLMASKLGALIGHE
jgi:hypothetical protein